MLKELRCCADYLVVVCNETTIVCGSDILEKYADDIFYRQNIGFDAGGFKDVLCMYLGWDKVLQFDELVLVNDSMFGPFKKMKHIFEEMDTKKVDFWGLIKFGESLTQGEYIPEHIQMFFCVIRSAMLHDNEFRKYWDKLPYYKTFNAVVHGYEMEFTSFFVKLGYSYATLADTQTNDSNNISNNYMQYGTICYELIKKRNFPFLKKQQIAYNTLNMQTQENLRQAIDHIAKNTDYDVNLIWQNIIRTMNVSDLQRNLHLRYVIDNSYEKGKSGVLALVIFAEYLGCFEYLVEYLDEAKHLCSIYVYSQNEKVLNEYKNINFIKCFHVSEKSYQNFLEEICEYDYVCIIHDVDMSSQITPSCTNKSYFYNIWENLVKDRKHIGGIAALFDKEKYLGFLTPPKACFANYFCNFGKGWNGKYEKIRTMVQKLKLNCQISCDKPPFSVSRDFWIRGSIIRSLLSKKIVEYEDLEYMWIYIVQDAGYYSGLVESDEYAAINETNLTTYLEQLASDVRKYFGDFNTFMDLEKVMVYGKIRNFCKAYTRIFIYGAGTLAKQYRELIPDAEAFVVSDGQEKPDILLGLDTFYLSQIEPDENIGIVICLNEKNQIQVIPLLEEKGFTNVLCV